MTTTPFFFFSFLSSLTSHVSWSVGWSMGPSLINVLLYTAPTYCTITTTTINVAYDMQCTHIVGGYT